MRRTRLAHRMRRRDAARHSHSARPYPRRSAVPRKAGGVKRVKDPMRFRGKWRTPTPPMRDPPLPAGRSPLMEQVSVGDSAPGRQSSARSGNIAGETRRRTAKHSQYFRQSNVRF
ncbi:Hypothetical protein NTJ_12454 [Nesidiocoris tenuis]|uniref:Uncharacterized protein n=1 Tax=Nesidiocoris tenuis TaxID=355587 RepID=A0ABN7BA04_9HEMI|nr:Hypothetical protein NTJ_12454 [Nesidiocoris tenuis]